MNPRERFLTAMRGGQPDRVPIAEFMLDDEVMKAACPEATDAADFCDRLDLDAVYCRTIYNRVHEFDDGSYIDEWGVRYKKGPELINHPIEGCIQSMGDLRKYAPPEPTAAHRIADVVEQVARYSGKRAIVFSGHRASFMWAVYVMGFENLLMAMAAEPKLAEAVLDMVLEVNMEVGRRAIRAGAEVVVVADDWAHNTAPLMSPDMFRRFILPRFRKMVDMIHDEGALCMKHTDGNIYPLLDMILSSGIDGLNPIEPVAGMHLAEVRKRVGSKLCLIGNIDCSKLLPYGTPEQVEEAVHQAMLDGGRDGAFILSSSNSIHSSCDPKNVLAMFEAGKRWGEYPLK